jgi:hypothetical protein
LQAPDIYVNGAPIGQPSDGVSYLRFLTVLKSKLPNKSVSIAAPASYWYLKAFPIDRIAAAIDYIVYMYVETFSQLHSRHEDSSANMAIVIIGPTTSTANGTTATRMPLILVLLASVSEVMVGVRSVFSFFLDLDLDR